jgi:hypothetical protein
MVIAHVSVRYAACCRMSLRETLHCKLRYSMYLTQVGGPKRKPGGGRRIQAAVLPKILTDEFTLLPIWKSKLPEHL